MSKARLVASTIAIAVAASGLALVPVSAEARGGLYDNCTNFNNRYPHGVGKRHAHDHTSGTPVTTFKKSNRIYRKAMNHNPDLDRDRDHIACEKA